MIMNVKLATDLIDSIIRSLLPIGKYTLLANLVNKHT